MPSIIERGPPCDTESRRGAIYGGLLLDPPSLSPVDWVPLVLVPDDEVGRVGGGGRGGVAREDGGAPGQRRRLHHHHRGLLPLDVRRRRRRGLPTVPKVQRILALCKKERKKNSVRRRRQRFLGINRTRDYDGNRVPLPLSLPFQSCCPLWCTYKLTSRPSWDCAGTR